MDRKLGGLILLALAGPAAAQGAPYCVYSSGPPQCFYYDVQSCRTAAQSVNAMCAPNNASQAQEGRTPVQPLDVSKSVQRHDYFGAMTRGLDAGQNDRIRRERHEANMRLMEARTAAQKRPATVFYNCASAGGDPFTDEPMVGCTVIFIDR